MAINTTNEENPLAPRETFTEEVKPEMMTLGSVGPQNAPNKPVGFNPVTGGIETVTPEIGVGTGIYSDSEKVKSIKDLGYSYTGAPLDEAGQKIQYQKMNQEGVFSRKE